MNKRAIFFIASLIIILLLAYIVDFHQQLAKIFHDRQQVKYYSERIDEDERLIHSKSQIEHDLFSISSRVTSLRIIDTPASLLFRIFYLARSSNCIVKLMNPREPKHVLGKNYESIDLVLIGELPQLKAFFYEIEQDRLPLVINHMNLHPEAQNEWRIEIFGTAFLEKLISSSLLSDKTNFPMDDTEFPVSQMHYAGQIESGHRQWAFVKLPNTKTLPVKIGSIIGIEKLLVVDINTKKQKIILMNKQEIAR